MEGDVSNLHLELVGKELVQHTYFLAIVGQHLLHGLKCYEHLFETVEALSQLG